MFDNMEKIMRYEKADYPGGSIYEGWNVGKIIHNSESDFLQVKINAFNQDLYSTMNINPSANYTISINSVSEFMSKGLVVIKDNKLLSYTYLSEEDNNNSSKKEDKNDIATIENTNSNK
jgi:hypothetical protein